MRVLVILRRVRRRWGVDVRVGVVPRLRLSGEMWRVWVLRLRGVDPPDGAPPSLVHVGATEIPHFRPLLEYKREIKIEKFSNKYISTGRFLYQI